MFRVSPLRIVTYIDGNLRTGHCQEGVFARDVFRRGVDDEVWSLDFLLFTTLLCLNDTTLFNVVFTHSFLLRFFYKNPILSTTFKHLFSEMFSVLFPPEYSTFCVSTPCWVSLVHPRDWVIRRFSKIVLKEGTTLLSWSHVTCLLITTGPGHLWVPLTYDPHLPDKFLYTCRLLYNVHPVTISCEIFNVTFPCPLCTSGL